MFPAAAERRECWQGILFSVPALTALSPPSGCGGRRPTWLGWAITLFRAHSWQEANFYFVSRQSQERSSLCSHSLHQEDLKGWLAVFGFAEMSRFTAAQMPGWCLGLRQVPSPALWSCREKPLLSAWDKLNPLSSDWSKISTLAGLGATIWLERGLGNLY